MIEIIFFNSKKYHFLLKRNISYTRDAQHSIFPFVNTKPHYRHFTRGMRGV